MNISVSWPTNRLRNNRSVCQWWIMDERTKVHGKWQNFLIFIVLFKIIKAAYSFYLWDSLVVTHKPMYLLQFIHTPSSRFVTNILTYTHTHIIGNYKISSKVYFIILINTFLFLINELNIFYILLFSKFHIQITRYFWFIWVKTSIIISHN